MIKLENRPVRILRYTSLFAPRWGTFHHGIDAGAEKRNVVGDPLYATADGVVMRVRPMHYLMGNYVVMEHDKSWCDMCEHMNDFNVKVGQAIKAGDLIGHMGTTGRSTGAHLHYEIRNCPYSKFYDKGVLGGFADMPKYAIDPKPYLDASKAPKSVKIDYSKLVADRCKLSKSVVQYLDKYRFADSLWEKLWAIIGKRRPMPSGRGNPDADLATAIMRECKLDIATIRYIWAYSDRQTVQTAIWVPLWFNMQ